MTLAEYITEASLTYSGFARHIGVSPETVRRYTTGERIPAHAVMLRIQQATNGRVTPNDFYSDPAAAPPLAAATSVLSE
jgi:DNA-binding transcriptional regulator YdaS (Cro superfamily)